MTSTDRVWRGFILLLLGALLAKSGVDSGDAGWALFGVAVQLIATACMCRHILADPKEQSAERQMEGRR